MHKAKIQIFLILIFLTAFSAIQIRSQEIPPAQKSDSAEIFPTTQNVRQNDDECSQMLDKTLDAFEKLKVAKENVDAELVTSKDLLSKESAYNAELLKAVALLTSSEKRDKSFFRKLLDQVGKALKAATSPEHLATIAGLIIIIRNLK